MQPSSSHLGKKKCLHTFATFSHFLTSVCKKLEIAYAILSFFIKCSLQRKKLQRIPKIIMREHIKAFLTKHADYLPNVFFRALFQVEYQLIAP